MKYRPDSTAVCPRRTQPEYANLCKWALNMQIKWLTSFLHEIEQLVQEGFAPGVVVQLVQLQFNSIQFNLIQLEIIQL